ncbi:MAG: catechol 1,2-dioxygenase [Cyclobacteriaceae bacterium]|nr:catechol 1,2-dioxygenase [Cyclobacteriaceae bacterium]
MDRRNFIKSSSLLAFSVSAFGSISWNGKNYAGDTATTTDILGPFYRPGSPIRSTIIASGSKGDVLHLSGTIHQKDGKNPLSNALIEIWQCDENEHYDNTSDEYRFRGALKTGKDGKYHFKTIVPVPYKASESMWRPAHIHIRVSSSDHQDLISQIYFKGDPHLSKDTSSASPHSAHRILEINKNQNNEHEVNFDIVMRDTFPLDPAMFDKITGLYQTEMGNVEFIQNDDLLYLKLNGQLMEGLAYKGNNTFEGGLGYIKTRFELLPDGGSKAVISVADYDNGNLSSVKTYGGERFLKYGD